MSVDAQVSEHPKRQPILIEYTTPLDRFRRFREDEAACNISPSDLLALLPRLQLCKRDGVFFFYDQDECQGFSEVFPTQRVFFQTWSSALEAVLALATRDVAWLISGIDPTS